MNLPFIFEISKDIVIKVILSGHNKDMFLKLKERYNLKYNVEVFHYLLKKMFENEFGNSG